MNNTTRSVLARNLQRRLEMAGMSQKDLADALGVNPSTVTFWLQERSAPRADMVDKICKVLLIDRADLVLEESASVGRSPAKTIPLYNSFYAEKNYFAESNIQRYFTIDQSVPADFGIIVSSPSMTGAGIDYGDITFFSKNYKFTEGNIYAVWMIGADSAALKRVYIRDNKYLLISEHPDTYPLVIENNEAFIIGELVSVYKEWHNPKEKVQEPIKYNL